MLHPTRNVIGGLTRKRDISIAEMCLIMNKFFGFPRMVAVLLFWTLQKENTKNKIIRG
jgi:hypothetical protein